MELTKGKKINIRERIFTLIERVELTIGGAKEAYWIYIVGASTSPNLILESALVALIEEIK